MLVLLGLWTFEIFQQYFSVNVKKLLFLRTACYSWQFAIHSINKTKTSVKEQSLRVYVKPPPTLEHM